MKKLTSPLSLALVAGFFTANASAQITWEAFNDHRGGASTSPNTTTWEMRATGSGGPLKNIETGADLTATMTVEEEGASDDFGANNTPNSGSPADLFFAGKCTIGGVGADGIPGVRASSATVIRLRFSNLDPSKRYNFRGTTCRGNAAYVDRWSIFKIVEAEGAAAAHVDGSANLNLFTADTYPASGMGPDEVALNSGSNLEGSMVGWDEINPGADGTFAIEARQYTGTAPFGTPAAAAYGYGLNAMYLAEVSTGGGGGGVGSITNVSAGDASVRIEWTGPGTLQSSDDLNTWADITGATSPYDFTIISTPTQKFFRLRE